MTDHFDTIAEKIGITRDSAVRSYCPDLYADTVDALGIVCEMVNRVAPDLRTAMQERLAAIAQENHEAAAAAAIAIHALSPDNYQTDTD